MLPSFAFALPALLLPVCSGCAGIADRSDCADAVTLLVKLRDWPAETHTSRFERARCRANKLTSRIPLR